MRIIETTAPISIDNLKLYFEDKSINFLIDYDKSQIQGTKLLTYLSNLEVKCDLKFKDQEQSLQVLEHYLQFDLIVNIPILEHLAIWMLKARKNNSDIQEVAKLSELLDIWLNKIQSLTLYNMYTINVKEYQQWVQSFPEDDTSSLIGCNFVSLLKHTDTYELFEDIDESKLKYYSKYFNDYMFKGLNLYSYWANENNPMFLLSSGISSGKVDSNEYIEAINKDIKEMVKHDTLI